jgi:hypothetical protein
VCGTLRGSADPDDVAHLFAGIGWQVWPTMISAEAVSLDGQRRQEVRMTLPRKGSRPITVDGVAYRWIVRRKPSYSQGIVE